MRESVQVFRLDWLRNRPEIFRNRTLKNGTHEQKLGSGGGRGRWILNFAAQCTIRYLAVRARATAGSVRKLVDSGLSRFHTTEGNLHNEEEEAFKCANSGWEIFFGNLEITRK
jgi:hypothetical protein